MIDEERDVVEFTDDEGNSLLLEVVDLFFYNGEEFAVLTEFEEGCGCEECADSPVHAGVHEDDAEEDDEQNLYIMKVDTFVDESGEEMEEFTPVDDDLMDKLIEIVQTRFGEGDDEEAEGGESE